MEQRVMYMNDPHGRQRAEATGKMESPRKFLMVVDCAVAAIAQQFAKLRCKGPKVATTVGEVMERCPKCSCLVVEDRFIATCQAEVKFKRLAVVNPMLCKIS